jgi:hypothetical protein
MRLENDFNGPYLDTLIKFNHDFNYHGDEFISFWQVISAYSGFQKHPCCQVSQFVKIYYSHCTRLKVETQLLIESVPCFIFCEVMYDLDVSVKFRSDQNLFWLLLMDCLILKKTCNIK